LRIRQHPASAGQFEHRGVVTLPAGIRIPSLGSCTGLPGSIGPSVASIKPHRADPSQRPSAAGLGCTRAPRQWLRPRPGASSWIAGQAAVCTFNDPNGVWLQALSQPLPRQLVDAAMPRWREHVPEVLASALARPALGVPRGIAFARNGL